MIHSIPSADNGSRPYISPRPNAANASFAIWTFSCTLIGSSISLTQMNPCDVIMSLCQRRMTLFSIHVETVLAGEITDGQLKIGQQLPTRNNPASRRREWDAADSRRERQGVKVNLNVPRQVTANFTACSRRQSLTRCRL